MMSLNVTIKFKKPKMVNYNETHAACGSTIMLCANGETFEAKEWRANVTHNMGDMAKHIPVCVKYRKKIFGGKLYDYVWRPDENGNPSTSPMRKILVNVIAYMLNNRNVLLAYNPSNGWGSYDSFLQWLISYKEACEDNPGRKISVDR